ncbi:SDR family NAD(P)-dependent oxidoreductase [Allokutzneria albata]|uniref:Short-chain dehydrogenase n=1 Tax=Allokutzneria albata TaxID=211114 RepID=A0A1G9QWH0_ALLAB|nr:SDR family NAD(P)-dependent oxidoreductase [Allokutzneria albata]SDM15366.1 Short-chain dehydrogenase [Allokutzneria albata]
MSPIAAALVTGATDGIGKATARRLAGLVDMLLIHGKRPAALEELARELAPANPGTTVVPLLADFTDLAQVDALAEAVLDRLDTLDLLINNAAVPGGQPGTTSRDGHEPAFQVNYLAPVLLTARLFEALGRGEASKIVNLSCAQHRSVRFAWPNMWPAVAQHPKVAYARSKLALAVHTCSLAGALDGTGMSAVSVDPGAIETKLLRATFGFSGAPPAAGADHVLHAATTRQDVNGVYFEGKRRVRPAQDALRRDAQFQLDAVTMRLLSLRPPWMSSA